MIDQLISNVASCSIELLKLCFFGSGKHTKTTRSRGARECFRRLLWLTFHVKVREKSLVARPFRSAADRKAIKKGRGNSLNDLIRPRKKPESSELTPGIVLLSIIAGESEEEEHDDQEEDEKAAKGECKLFKLSSECGA